MSFANTTQHLFSISFPMRTYRRKNSVHFILAASGEPQNNTNSLAASVYGEYLRIRVGRCENVKSDTCVCEMSSKIGKTLN